MDLKFWGEYNQFYLKQGFQITKLFQCVYTGHTLGLPCMSCVRLSGVFVSVYGVIRWQSEWPNIFTTVSL